MYALENTSIVCRKPPLLTVEAEDSLVLRALVFPFRGNLAHPLCGWAVDVIIPLIFRKGKALYRKNKISLRAVCPIIALLFFFAMLTPAVVQAQAHESSENANSLGMLKLALAVKNGNTALSEEKRLALKEKALILMENLFKKIELSGISEETIKQYDCMLPQGLAEKLLLVSDIAKAGISTEEKVHALVSAFDTSCDSIFSGAAIVILLGFLGIAYFGSFGAVLILAAVLCCFGVF